LKVSEGQEQCSVQRHQSTENWAQEATSLDDLRLAVSCQDEFKIITSSGSVLFTTKEVNYVKDGGVATFFKSGLEPSSFII
jgi:hypothetical protein